MTCIFAITAKKSAKALKQKRAGGVWLSWVLLFAFVIALSAASYRFIIPLVQDTTEDMKKVVFNTDECRQVAISIEEACQDSTAQHLNMTIRNRNYIKLDELRYQALDTRNVPVISSSQETQLGPNRAKRYQFDTNTSETIRYAKVTPVLYIENMEIICSEKEAETSTIPNC